MNSGNYRAGEHVATIRSRRISWNDRAVVQHGLNSDRIIVEPDGEWLECDSIEVHLSGNGIEVEVLVTDENRAVTIPKKFMERPGKIGVAVVGKGDGIRLVTALLGSDLVVVDCGTGGVYR